MKTGDFVAIHAEEGCFIGKLISEEGKSVTVSIGNNEFYNVPRSIVTLWVSVGGS